MLQKIFIICSGVKMTAISGIFLACSLFILLSGGKPAWDPAILSVVISGYPRVYEAFTKLVKEKEITSDLLVSLAMAASLSIGELFAAGEIAFIMAVGEILENMTIARARKGLSELLSLAPAEGRILETVMGTVVEKVISAADIKKGDIVRVLPGETIPVDGVIISGDTSVDQSILTGESLPVDKAAGDSIYCGTINCYGAVDMKAVGTGEDSSLQKLIRMVREAERKKSPMQRVVDKWASWLVPAALALAIITIFVNIMSGVETPAAVKRGVTVLVVFCPCALALATPTSVMAAIGQAAKYGVIIKSGEALERMGQADTVAFDKTGTLTEGKLEVSDIIPFRGMQEAELLYLAAGAEAKSEHPLARAIVARAVDIPESTSFRMAAGRGVNAVVAGKNIYCGNEKYFAENNIGISAAAACLEKLRREGKASVLVADGEECIGVIALSDILRPQAADVVKSLNDMQVQTVLLTGDNKLTAEYFAGKIGIREVRAELLPEEKVDNVSLMQCGGSRVCMIGDGVNDAPALKSADVGVAMGGMGSDIAVEAADIALMGDDISRIPYLKRLADAAFSLIKKNIVISMAINGVAVLMSVTGYLTPITGALVHNAGSVLVILNAALLYDRNFQ